MLDAQKILQQFLGGQQTSKDQKSKSGGINSDHVTGAAVGGLAGLLLGSKSARKMAGPVAQLGGLAAVGTLAFQAWQTWQAKQNEKPAVSSSAQEALFLPNTPAAQNETALLILSAMIAAAKSDGHIDASEQDKIFAKVDELGLSSEEKAMAMDQLRRPLPIADLVAMAKTPEHAVEIYTASVLAIQPDTAAEVTYLNQLAKALNLDPSLRQTVDAVVKAA